MVRSQPFDDALEKANSESSCYAKPMMGLKRSQHAFDNFVSDVKRKKISAQYNEGNNFSILELFFLSSIKTKELRNNFGLFF